jgi:pheromone shutdown protein TraB
MSQQWEYRAVAFSGKPSEREVNAELARWASQGWELVNGSFTAIGATSAGGIWLFWRRAK